MCYFQDAVDGFNFLLFLFSFPRHKFLSNIAHSCTQPFSFNERLTYLTNDDKVTLVEWCLIQISEMDHRVY